LGLVDSETGSATRSGLVASGDQICFLCSPNPDLLVRQSKRTNLIAGLGPIVENYCLVASTDHVPSLADLLSTRPATIKEIASLRATVQERVGPILMAEHGRVPVCRDDRGGHEAQCYHAHALFFPTSVSIEQQALSYYMNTQTFSSLTSALEYARSTENYLLVSPNPARFAILSGPLSAPRQLARTLVAHAHGVLERADWRTCPLAEEALRNADRIREVLKASPWPD
jgi:hypothetical protein